MTSWKRNRDFTSAQLLRGLLEEDAGYWRAASLATGDENMDPVAVVAVLLVLAYGLIVVR